MCFKRKGQIIFVFLATFCTVAIGNFIVKPVYQAQAQILVKVGRENVYVPANDNLNPVFRVDRKEELNSAIEILKSPSLVEKAVMALGPVVLYEKLGNYDQNRLFAMLKSIKSNIKQLVKQLLPDRRNAEQRLGEEEKILQEAILQFTKDLKIEGIKNSNIINIGFRHENPQLAAKAINQLASNYLDHYLKVYKTEQSNDFYQRQADLLKGRWDKNEEKLKELKTSNNITSLGEQQVILLNKAAELRADLNKTFSQETETRNRITALRNQLAGIPETIPQEAEAGDNPYLINTLEARLVELQLEEKKLLTKYTDESRLLQNVREEIKIVKNRLNEQEEKKYERSRSGVNVTYKELQSELLHNETELTALEAKAKTQKYQLEDYQKELEKLNQIEAQYKRIIQEIEQDRKNYQNYLNKQEDSRISEAMDTAKIASVSLIEPAKPPLEPISPKKKLNLLIGIIFGIFGGLGCAFFLEYLDDSLEQPEDVEDFLGTIVLASIPKLKK